MKDTKIKIGEKINSNIIEYKKEKEKLIKDVHKEKTFIDFIAYNSLMIYAFRKALGKSES